MDRRVSVQFLVRLCVCMAWAFVLVVPCVAQDSVSGLGIFDATADWGLEPEFGPKIGTNKVPGNLSITTRDGEDFYVLFGNGDRIWDRSDEGFYAYTERAGSWRIRAKLEWLDYGQDNDNLSNAGLMIRKKGFDSNSSHSYININTPKTSKITFNNYARIQSGRPTIKTSRGFNKEVLKSLCLRITRLAEEKLVFSEWSLDGKQWALWTTETVDLEDAAAYGIVITNHDDNRLLAKARFSDIHIEPAGLLIRRFFSQKKYVYPGYTLDVEMQVYNPSSSSIITNVTETLPKGWTPVSIFSEGKINDRKLVWKDVQLVPGRTWLRYIVEIPQKPKAWA